MTRGTYTADAVAVLLYLVDRLPAGADHVFAAAEAGESVIHVPSTALAEVVYSFSRDKDVRGVALEAGPAVALQDLIADAPVSVVPVGEEDLQEYATVVEDLSMHDALVVASHRRQETDAILTSDAAIRDAGVSTIWD